MEQVDAASLLSNSQRLLDPKSDSVDFKVIISVGRQLRRSPTAASFV